MTNYNSLRGLIRHLPAAVVLIVLSACASPGDKRVRVDLRPHWDTLRVLENPGKGWYHHMIDNGINRYGVLNESVFASFPGMDHLYLRIAWSFLEPEEGTYDWSRLDEVIDEYVPKGYGISFRISSKERRGHMVATAQRVDGVDYATPYWVRQAGAKGVVVESKGTGEPAWSPDWDDQVYLEKLDNFHRAFAARYGGKPWVRYVDVGSIGDYGEGHTSASTKIPPTVEEVKANIDVYVRNYKHTQIICTDDLLKFGKDSAEQDELLEYAVSNGLSLRDDSPMVGWYIRTYMDTWTISHPRFYEPLYLERPIVLELQHYSSVKRSGHWLGKNGSDTIPSLGVTGAQIFRGAMETLHATWIGYHGHAEVFLQDNPDLTGELLNRCGYWYFPVSADYPARMSKGRNDLTITWLNKGVAPAYTAYPLVFRFEPEDEGEKNFEITVQETKNTEWLPEVEQEESYAVEIPDGVPAGEYLLKFKLQDRKGGEARDVLLGIDASLEDEDHFVLLGNVTLK